MEKKTRNELAFEFIDQVACTIVIATFFICAVVTFDFWGKDHLPVVATIIVANVAAYLWVHYACKTKLNEANEHSEELEAELREIKENCERNSMPEHERYTLRMKNRDAKHELSKRLASEHISVTRSAERFRNALKLYESEKVQNSFDPEQPAMVHIIDNNACQCYDLYYIGPLKYYEDFVSFVARVQPCTDREVTVDILFEHKNSL